MRWMTGVLTELSAMTGSPMKLIGEIKSIPALLACLKGISYRFLTSWAPDCSEHYNMGLGIARLGIEKEGAEV